MTNKSRDLARTAAVVGALILGIAAINAATIARALSADFNRPITQLDGRPFTDGESKPVKMTLGIAAETALLATYPDEQNLDGAEKFKRFLLAKRIGDAVAAGVDLTLSAEDTALLKKLIAKAYNPLITGQAWLMLDPGMAPSK